eukprot:ANDGO_04611.mRNA.1 hypothetical protein
MAIAESPLRKGELEKLVHEGRLSESEYSALAKYRWNTWKAGMIGCGSGLAIGTLGNWILAQSVHSPTPTPAPALTSSSFAYRYSSVLSRIPYRPTWMVPIIAGSAVLGAYLGGVRQAARTPPPTLHILPTSPPPNAVVQQNTSLRSAWDLRDSKS